LHQRFEEAVRQLGLASAKPQAIWQLMDCGSESDAPTRKNVKSHWQKYRVAHGCPTVHATSANSLPGPHLAPCFAGRVVLLPLNSPSHAAI
jgi:SHAQKYF class myb-like DNA-binding protein